MKENSAVRMIVTLVVIAVVVAGIMSVVNNITAPVIAENAEKELNLALSEVMDADKFDKKAEKDGNALYLATKNGEEIGVCIVWYTPGYGGDVKVLTGIDKNLTVTGVRILEHSETPGLGANSTKESFYTQYNGKTKEIGVKKNSPGENDIQALSGATVTSKAVTKAVNTSLVEAEKYFALKDNPTVLNFGEEDINE